MVSLSCWSFASDVGVFYSVIPTASVSLFGKDQQYIQDICKSQAWTVQEDPPLRFAYVAWLSVVCFSEFGNILFSATQPHHHE